MWANENVSGSITLFDGLHNSHDGDDDGDNNKINIKFIERYFPGNDSMELYKQLNLQKQITYKFF